MFNLSVVGAGKWGENHVCTVYECGFFVVVIDFFIIFLCNCASLSDYRVL